MFWARLKDLVPRGVPASLGLLDGRFLECYYDGFESQASPLMRHYGLAEGLSWRLKPILQSRWFDVVERRKALV